MTEPSDTCTVRNRESTNRSWLYFGLAPFGPSLLIGLAVGHPGFLLAPLYGFCPLDVVRVHSSPSPQQLFAWGLVSAVLCVGFALYAYFRRPLGVVFAVLLWSSTIVLLFRIWGAMKHIQ
jgi:hypothetical protein